MDFVVSLNNLINNIIWGVPGLLLVLITGLFLTVRLRFLQFRYLGSFIRNTVFKGIDFDNFNLGELAPFKAAMVSVSAMVGSGNIAGVATAVVLGGPGALFWMVVAAFIGMATKFTEICLSVKYRSVENGVYKNGGPMFYFEKRLKQRWLGIVYAVFTLFYAFVITAIVDSNTISLSFYDFFGIQPVVTGGGLSLLTAFVILGGVKKIGEICKFLAPFMASAYLICGFIIIVLNITLLPDAIALIIKSAFNPAAYTGGAVGSVMIAMRYGISRGIFSNDAGLGVAGIIHASAKTDSPSKQGMWGPVEVLIDTVLICGMSGIIIVLSGCWNSGLSGGSLAISSFNHLLPGIGQYICLLALFFFGFSCIISFYVYVEKAGKYLFQDRCVLLLKMLWIFMVFIGSQSTLGFVWDLADTVNGLMMIPNLLALIYLSSEVVYLVRKDIDVEDRRC